MSQVPRSGSVWLFDGQPVEVLSVRRVGRDRRQVCYRHVGDRVRWSVEFCYWLQGAKREEVKP